ncbi:MAG: hypothetical protein H7256_03355 [Bdellovibrio sp.]|nr:hypothetical protein [Bdellovibrio sp.]
MITQLNPPLPLDTPKGPGQATFLIDYGLEHDLYWVVFIDETRECWTLNNKDVRAQRNLTIGRGKFQPLEEKKISLSSVKSPEVKQPFVHQDTKA